ncbi:methyltransferase [Planomonospora sphaerica]|uniref:methyltransferase n=1 Tax=Planomonospora sphaerica TaxID=161355 RepID=UPI000A0001D9|nr:methyltransferase [Planomonospora sphaerica]
MQHVISGVWEFGALLAAAELDIADHLAHAPLTVAELADRCHAHPDSLRRVLRTLAPYRLARPVAGERWKLTAIGEVLRGDAEGTLRRAVMERADPEAWDDVRTWPTRITAGRSIRPWTGRTGRNAGALRPPSAAALETLGVGLWDTIKNVDDFGALLVAAQLDLIARLKQPTELQELAKEYDADPESLRWMLNRLNSYGLLSSPGRSVYALRKAGETLQRDRPDSTRPAVLMNGQELWWDMLRRLPATVRAGRPALPDGITSTYAWLDDNPEALQLFHAFMATRTHPIARVLADDAFPQGSTVVDVGGGQGTIIAAILQAHPTCRGVLLERPRVAERARSHLQEHGLLDRCTPQAGDFFTDVPAGGHTYVLGSVLHNWPDQQAQQILARVHDAMARTPGPSRLLCIDMLLPVGDEPHPGLRLDMRMCSLFGEGQERTKDEYDALLTRAGFQIHRQARLPHTLTLTEAVPATA